MLQTKQDYLNYLAINRDKGIEELKLLLYSRFSWTNTRVLDSPDPTGLVIDENHRIIGSEDDFYYQEYLEDNMAKLFRIGFTVQEVEDLINES